MNKSITEITPPMDAHNKAPKFRKKISAVIIATITACLCSTAPSSFAEQKKDTVVSFSGGGYHALTGAASWMMGMMARNEQDLAAVTKNVDAFGSNSGGSWFMSLSAYSPSFVDGLNAAAQDPAVFTSDGGYMGLAWQRLQKNKACERSIIDKPICFVMKELLEAGGLLGLSNLLLSGGGQWQQSIENDVFGAPINVGGKTDVWPFYEEVSGKTLSSKPLGWLGDKDWILAGTFLTANPSLTYTSKGLTGFTGIQSLQGATQAFNEFHPLPGGVPMMLTGSENIDFLPTGDLTLTYGSWNNSAFTPSSDPSGNSITIAKSAINNSMRALPVMNAAGISSAAGGGFINIPDLAQTIKLEPKKVATALNGLAPAYQLNDGSGNAMMKFVEKVHNTFVTRQPPPDVEALSVILKDNTLVRMADGGFMDNTAVAQMLRYLQDQNGGKIPDGFNIIAFDDFPAPQGTWNDSAKTALPTGNDVASLFGFTGCTGKGNKKQCGVRESNTPLHSAGLLGFQFTGVSPQVFPCEQYFTKGEPSGNQTCAGIPNTAALYWQAEAEERIMCSGKEQPLTYAKYEVSTDTSLPGSRLYNLKNNVSGTLHVFSTLGSGAAVVPGNKAGFACYTEMVEKIVANVKSSGGDACDTNKPRTTSNKCTLGDYLEAALN